VLIHSSRARGESHQLDFPTHHSTFLFPPSSGIPQIILPQWYDLYDYAARAEYLGIGIYANKLVAPSVDAAEFGAALIEIVKPGSAYARKAQALKKICEEKCGGRDAGARRLLEVADEEMAQRK
jgi:UDP:flavonoid glycosyltransferase YjiC (YdhE family)